MLGTTILGYTVDELIGAGGFGEVYKVSKTTLAGTEIRALKHISIPTKKQYMDVLNSMAGDYQKADNYFDGILQNVISEIKIIRSMSSGRSANIVAYYENDIVENRSPRTYDIFILMEYLTPLTEYIEKNSLTVRSVVGLAKDMLAALTACHEKNIIHRDIKEDNIFISAEGVYKLGDFGVSKMLSNKSGAVSMKGTPGYIAPEVYLGKEKYDNTVDLYSLGIVLYRLLNGSRGPFLPAYPNPFTSDDEDEAFAMRMKEMVPDLPYYAKNPLGEAIVHALKPRGERYPATQEFLAAITQAEEQLSDEELDTVVWKPLPIPEEEERKPNISRVKTSGNTVEYKQAPQQQQKQDNPAPTPFDGINDPDRPSALESVLKQAEQIIKEERLKVNAGVGQSLQLDDRVESSVSLQVCEELKRYAAEHENAPEEDLIEEAHRLVQAQLNELLRKNRAEQASARKKLTGILIAVISFIALCVILWPKSIADYGMNVKTGITSASVELKNWKKSTVIEYAPEGLINSDLVKRIEYQKKGVTIQGLIPDTAYIFRVAEAENSSNASVKLSTLPAASSEENSWTASVYTYKADHKDQLLHYKAIADNKIILDGKNAGSSDDRYQIIANHVGSAGTESWNPNKEALVSINAEHDTRYAISCTKPFAEIYNAELRTLSADISELLELVRTQQEKWPDKTNHLSIFLGEELVFEIRLNIEFDTGD